MKTRFGYVSNSSSSSFVIYGTELDTIQEVELALSDGKRVVMVDEGGGTSGDCADFVMDVTRERYALMKKKLALYYRKVSSGKFDDAELRFFDCEKAMYDDVDDEQIIMHAFGSSRGREFYCDKDEDSPRSDAVDDKDWLYWLGHFMYDEPDDEQ